jgi:hypothetical protein
MLDNAETLVNAPLGTRVYAGGGVREPDTPLALCGDPGCTSTRPMVAARSQEMEEVSALLL